MAAQPHPRTRAERDRLASDERLRELPHAPEPPPAERFTGDLAALRDRLTRASDLLPAARSQAPEDLFPTAIPAVDAILGGGLPRGCLTELRGGPSTGRLSLVLALLAAATRRGEAAALVDLGDHLDPQAAESAGVDLARLLWARPRRLRDALAAAEIALGGAFPLVVLELGGAPVRGKRDEHAWLRLARAARHHRGALLVASPYRTTGSAAAEVLALSRRRGVWLGAGAAPRLLAGVESRLEREKSRRLPQPAAAALAWRAPAVVVGARPMPTRQLSLAMVPPPSAGLRAARAAAAEAAAVAPMPGSGAPPPAAQAAPAARLRNAGGTPRAAAAPERQAAPARPAPAAKAPPATGKARPPAKAPAATPPRAAAPAVDRAQGGAKRPVASPAKPAPAAQRALPLGGGRKDKPAAGAAGTGRPQPLPGSRPALGPPWPARQRRVPRWVPLARAALNESMRSPVLPGIGERAVPAPPSARDRRV